MTFKQGKYWLVSDEPGGIRLFSDIFPRYYADVVEVTTGENGPESVLHGETITVFRRVYGLKNADIQAPNVTELKPAAVRDALKWYQSYRIRDAETKKSS